MTNKLSERQLARLKELYAAFLEDRRVEGHVAPPSDARGWRFSRDLRTDESLYKRGLVNRRGIPGDVWHSLEYCITRAGYEAQID